MDISWFLIVNPTAGNGKFDEKWKKIQAHLKNQKISYSFALTAHSKHEITLAQQAINKGFTHIISVGGDGTLHHVINGIMTQSFIPTSKITVGVIPLGTGNDWIKTYGIPKAINNAVKLIKKQRTILQDIGYLTLENKTTFFNNVAGLGYDGYVVNKLNKLKRFGAIAYLLSGITGLLFYKKTTLKIEFDNHVFHTKCLMTLFGICKYAAGGMRMTAYQSASDGLLDITIAKNLSLFDLLMHLPKLYNGKIVNHKKVSTYRTKHIIVTPMVKNKRFPFIQADGELIGNGKVTVSIIEKALNFVV
ncbi:Diacylglycerol kinase [Tenacibaculum maritimum]|uniref:diacylglycerol/lipid kinase family protein n=1 Tax=Tenacibaculum maritimum TaxID=107401 RepID=UPI0012E42C7E|nr:diacylglycerol kinase family protein [Tenacibaculum maritimum]CAA0231602.1 Diacylglycerol kinase [Tenacibaculum maritimum]